MVIQQREKPGPYSKFSFDGLQDMLERRDKWPEKRSLNLHCPLPSELRHQSAPPARMRADSHRTVQFHGLSPDRALRATEATGIRPCFRRPRGNETAAANQLAYRPRLISQQGGHHTIHRRRTDQSDDARRREHDTKSGDLTGVSLHSWEFTL